MAEWALGIAQAIARDIENRAGLGNEWDMIDEDIQDEILEKWATLIAAGAKFLA